ncbi:MAG: hypothetical protein HGB11_09365 [Chlorobiales bacterium]|nr:hypothetical protein [Chlorobiales bacterium]
MKKRKSVFTALFVALSIVASGVIYGVPDILSRLGINQNTAQDNVLYAYANGNVNYYLAAKSFKAAASSERVDLVKSLLGWVKTYTASPTFQKAYAALREERKPSPPVSESYDEVMKKQRADAKKQQEEALKGLEKMPPETRKQVEAAIKQSIATQKEMDNNPEFQKMQKDGFIQDQARKKEQYQESMKRWEEDYPADSKVLVAKRLKSFLDLSADVNFDAKLTQRGDRKIFADPNYERKSSEWKLCYRAGKETVNAAREFSSSWLKELGAK